MKLSGLDFFFFRAEQVAPRILAPVDEIKELTIDVDKEVRSMYSPDHVVIAVQYHVQDADATEHVGEDHEDDAGDHARYHTISSCILKERTYQEATDRDTDKPDEGNETELVVVCHIDIKITEKQRIHLRMQTSVREVVRQLAQTAREYDMHLEDQTTHSHHHMEHILVGLAHDHGHMMLFHLLRNDDSHKDHQDGHQEQYVSLTREHEGTIDIVADGRQTLRIRIQEVPRVVANVINITSNEASQVCTRIGCDIY